MAKYIPSRNYIGSSEIATDLDVTGPATFADTVTISGDVGIGTSTPSDYYSDDLVISSADEKGMTIAATTTSATNYIMFADGTSGNEAYRGYVGYNHSSDYLRFGTSGSEKMRLTSDGKLGLGVTSPDVQFHASGDVKFTNAFVLDSIKHSGDSDTKIGFDTDTIKFDTNSSEKMRLTSGGRLGIGTSSPAHELSVVSLNDRTAVGIDIGSNASFDFAANSTSGYSTLFYMDDVGLDIGHDSTSRAINFKTGGSDRVTITGAGNLGIGTTSPSEKLEIVGKAIIRKSGSATAHSDTDLLVTDATASSSTAAIQILGGNAGFSNLQFSDTDSYSQGAIIYNHTDNYMAFKANAAEKMRILSNGNLLLGTTTDSARLTVDETTTNNLTVAHLKHNQGGVISDILLENSAGADNTGFDINFKLASSGAAAKIGAIRTNSPGAGDTDMFFSTSTNGTTVTEAMRITHDANVGIGTASPASKLDVRGTVQVGVNDTGHDVIFYGATSGKKMQWDESADTLILTGTLDVSNGELIPKSITMPHVSDPSDPADGRSVIWSDTSGNLKIKINVGGSVVTKTIATYE